MDTQKAHILDSIATMPRERFQNPTMFQTKKGVYCIRAFVDILTKDGPKRKKKTIQVAQPPVTKREALTRRNKLVDALNQCQYLLQMQIPFNILLDEYLVNHVRRIDNLASSTRERYELAIKNHIRPAFGEIGIHKITPMLINAWLQEKAKDGLSWATRSSMKNCLSGVITKAIEWGRWPSDKNPVEKTTAGRMRPKWEHRKLTDEQHCLLLNHLPHDVRIMCLTGLFCTLRVSEMLGLQEKHLDFDQGLILVRQRYYRGDLDVPKNRRAIRDIPMGRLIGALKQLCTGDPERFVFQIKTKYGICRDDRDINQHFLRPAAIAAGVYEKGFGFHAFRREAITQLRRIHDKARTQYLSGHSSEQMTDLYTLYDPEYEKLIAGKILERLGKAVLQ